jgi:hypothetical protein
MNWKLIVGLSLFGLAIGVAGISVLSSTGEPFAWLVAFLISAYLIARFARGWYFVHGLLVALLNSVWVTAAHLLFYPVYMAHHPEFLQMLAATPLSTRPRVFMLAQAPVAGLISGIVLGLFSFIASRIFRPRSR